MLLWLPQWEGLFYKTISNFHGFAFGETFRGEYCSSITCQRLKLFTLIFNTYCDVILNHVYFKLWGSAWTLTLKKIFGIQDLIRFRYVENEMASYDISLCNHVKNVFISMGDQTSNTHFQQIISVMYIFHLFKSVIKLLYFIINRETLFISLFILPKLQDKTCWIDYIAKDIHINDSKTSKDAVM